jgi:hypothetical protein
MVVAPGRISGVRTVSRRRVTFGLMAALTLATAACGAPTTATSVGQASTAASLTARTSEGGQVTVTVTWGGPSAGPRFGVTMDTHLVDLDGYDLTKLAVLRVDGRPVVQPGAWDAPKGGHHRKGALSFATTAADGKPFIDKTTRSVELIIRDVAGVPERNFRWELSS